MTLQAGDRLGDYEIIGVLGRGGMGKVFRVRNLISDRVEAMKVVLPDLEADPGFADRFLREIKVHASLDHPNIARLYTAFRAEDRICMILELVDGVSLHEKLLQGPVALREGVLYMDQVLAALDYAHGRGVIHRDLKPANIIVPVGRPVKLTDFGIARAAGAPKLTLTGVALGSLYYLSPEQVRTGTVDARSDLYSLGVTFYETITGKRPIEGDTEYSIMNAHVEQIPVPPTDLNPQLPASVSSVILKALAKNPGERFQSAAEFRSALRAAAELADAATSTIFRMAASASTAELPAANRIPAEQLARIESKLLPLLGPIARHLIAKAGRRHASVRELCQDLAEQIPQQDRAAFLRACEGEAGSTTATAHPPRAATTTGEAPAAPQTGGLSKSLDAAVLQAAKQKLASFIGPIAGILVDRMARRTRTERELYEALAAEIPAERDRAAFLASVPR